MPNSLSSFRLSSLLLSAILFLLLVFTPETSSFVPPLSAYHIPSTLSPNTSPRRTMNPSQFTTRTRTSTNLSFSPSHKTYHPNQRYSRTSKMTRLYASDYYGDLGVSRSASARDIKSAFRRIAKIYHPDLNKEPDAAAKYASASKAYEVIGDEDKKRMYDQFGDAGVDGSMGSGGGFGGGQGENIDLSDIFSSFFNGGGAGGGFGGSAFGGGGSSRQQSKRSNGPQPGEDLRFDLLVDFNTAIFGGDEKVRIRHLEKCVTCTGSGVKEGARVVTCKTCEGNGVVTQLTKTPLGNFQTQQTCGNCKGTGESVTEYCSTCTGQGRVEKTKTVKINIPPGVEDGNKLRVKGEGDAGPKGGSPGDLYIFLKVRPSKTFKRDGSEISSEVSVNMYDATLGANIKVETVDGMVEIKVPAGTQPGQVMRVKNKGAPKLGNPTVRGDHYATINIEIPRDITAEEREGLTKFRDRRKGRGGGGGGGGGGDGGGDGEGEGESVKE